MSASCTLTPFPPPITTANANRLEKRGGAGSIRVSGTVDKASTVTVNGQPARVTSTAGAAPFHFEKDLAVATGAQTFTIAATDGSTPPQTSTQTYSITIPATHQTYEHDLNGNLRHIRSGGTTVVRSYEWDAANRLTKIIYADNGSTTFQYDGMSQRRIITEKNAGGAVTSTTRLLWLEGRVWQEQDSSSRVTRRYHFNGAQTLTYTGAATTPTSTTSTLTLSDHLGSHREVVTLVSNVPTLVGWRDFDPYGKTTQVGVVPSNAAYTGHWLHDRSGLELALYRAYDPELGRWLNEDPLGEEGGLNLYGYVGNGPVGAIDPLGLVDIFVGGFGDQSSNGAGSVRRNASAFGAKYFTFDQRKEIEDFINSQKAEEPINLVGHSYGADTAARAAINSKRCIDSLLTIDPVSIKSTRPDYAKIKASTKLWINVDSTAVSVSNFIAGAGRAWNDSVQPYVDQHIKSKNKHADFLGMLVPALQAKESVKKKTM